MKNPTRRNRNIGTAKQGHGKNNKLVIPYPTVEMKSFFERLGVYTKVDRIINGERFRFVVERTRENSFHSCTIDDICKVIENIPKNEYGELRLIILRQPTRKQEILNPVFGRLIYSYEFENKFEPAIILEAFDFNKKFEWTKKLSIENQKELERLVQDGHDIRLSKRHYEAEFRIKNVRSTQLYRTLLHEFGHYFHYQNIVLKPLLQLKNELDLVDGLIDDDDTSETNSNFEKWEQLDEKYELEKEKLENSYFSIISKEKEYFAHNYADKMGNELKRKGLIPFKRIIELEKMDNENLKINDFIKK